MAPEVMKNEEHDEKVFTNKKKSTSIIFVKHARAGRYVVSGDLFLRAEPRASPTKKIQRLFLA
jgi:hypothetical protein